MSVLRTNPGRVELYREAAGIVREERSELIQVWLTILGAVVFLNLPWFPRWFAGLATGALLTFLACMTYWSIWYASGLGNRLAGTWAEGFTAEELAQTTSIAHVTANLRFDGYDLDHAVVTRHGVYAIETKHHHRFYANVLLDDARRAAKTGRTLRLALTRGRQRLLPDDPALFTTVLVVWGRGGRQLIPMLLDTDYGPVIVTPGSGLVAWFNSEGRGGLTSSQVEALSTYLATTAIEREAAHAPKSWWLRRLARVK